MMPHDRHFSIPKPDSWKADGEGPSRIMIDCYGSGDYVIEVRGELFKFDWSEQFGPLPLRKNGGELRLGPNHKFWRAASLWNLQGQRLEGKRAIWHEPKQPVLKHDGKFITYAEDGEPGWDW